MNQKGTLNLVLVGIIVVVAGITAYLLLMPKFTSIVVQPVPISAPKVSASSAPTPDQTADWKTYRNEKYEFEYPAIISLKQDGENITLSHSIAYKHDNSCDFKGDAPILEKLLDFKVSFSIFNGAFKNAIQSNNGSDFVKNFFENNTLKLTTGFIDSFTAGSLKGFEVINVFEGCGRTAYYFPISPTETLIINRSLITELILNSEAYLNLSGIIPPNQEKEFFTKILSTFKFTEKVDTVDWKTYNNPKVDFSILYPPNLELKEHLNAHSEIYFINLRLPILKYTKNEIYREDIAIGFRNKAYYEDKYKTEPSFQEVVAEARRRASADSLVEEKNITISNTSAVEFKYRTNPSNISGDEVIAYEIYMQKSNGKIFSIGAFIKSSVQEIYEPIFNQILSTFRFTK